MGFIPSSVPAAHAPSHKVGSKAFYFGIGANETIDPAIKISAVFNGSLWNGITLNFNGSNDLDTTISNWNSSNPDKEIELIIGAGDYVPEAGESITLSGGENDGSDVLANINQNLGTNNNVKFLKVEASGLQIKGTTSNPPPTTIYGNIWIGTANGNEGFIIDNGGNSFGANTIVFTGVNQQVTQYKNVIMTSGFYPQIYLGTNGNVGIRTDQPEERLDVNGNIAISDTSSGKKAVFRATPNLTDNRTYDIPNTSGKLLLDTLLITSATAPTSATASGIAGEIRADSNYIYICTATDTWKRTSVTGW